MQTTKHACFYLFAITKRCDVTAYRIKGDKSCFLGGRAFINLIAFKQEQNHFDLVANRKKTFGFVL